MILDNYEIVQSMSGDRSYSATVSVIAYSEYAKVYLTAQVEYMKYDQGWVCDYCDWNIDDYEVMEWPDEDEMSMFIVEREEEVEDYMRYPDYTKLSNDGVSTIIYEGTINTEYDGFVGIEGSVVSYWSYDVLNDTFKFDTDESDLQLTLVRNIEGKWTDQRMSTGYIELGGMYHFIITDQGEDQFTIEYTYDDLKETVYLVSDFDTFKETGALIFENNNPEYQTQVELYGSEDDGYVLQYRSDYNDTNFDYNKWAYIY
ncbi:MAG: hypothetical protein ACI4S2_04285 [Lachnospiraceae bacterium]